MHTSYKSNLRKVAGAVAVAAFALLSFVGCKDDKTDDATTLTLSPTSLSFTAEAESKQVTIKTSVSAEQLAAVPDASWCHPVIRGKTLMMVSVDANDAEEARTATVTVQTSDGITATVAVTQLGLNPNLLVDKTEIPVEAAGQTVKVAVTSNIEWIPENNNDWIDASSNEDGSELTLVVAESPLFEAREGEITLSPVREQFAEYAKTIKVTQKANEYSITVTSDQITDNVANMNSNADDIIVSLVANSAWEITSEQDWITPDPAEGGKTSGQEIIIGIDENQDTEARTGTIVFTCGEASQTITVNQRGAGLFLDVEDDYKSLSFTDAGGEVSFSVTTNGTLTASPDADWFSASVNDNTVTVTVNENSGEKRTGKVTLSAAQEGLASVTLDIAVSQLKFATDLSANGTANCYIVPAAGTYKFNAKVMGNGVSTDRYVAVAQELNPNAAALVWSTVDTTANNQAITDIEYANGWIYFSTDGTEQNTVIAAQEVIKDNFGNESKFIVWSWHLWITPYDPEQPINQYDVLNTSNDAGMPGTPAMGATWMSRNLGAFSDGGGITNDDPKTRSYAEVQKSFGLLYQWGRKDPFPGGIVNDWGTVDNNWSYNPETAPSNDVIYYYDQLDDAGMLMSSAERIRGKAIEFESTKDNVQDAIENPHLYFTNTSYPYWWISTSQCIENGGSPDPVDPINVRDGWGLLWGNPSDDSNQTGEKSIYDPCPVGWQVPCGAMFKFVTSHADAASAQWGTVGIFRINTLEAYKDQENMKLPDRAVSGWPDGNQAALTFPSYRGGFNFFIEDNCNNYQEDLGVCIPKEENYSYSNGVYTKIDPMADDIHHIGISERPEGLTMFMPAAGQRTYAGGLVRVGSSLRYQENGIRNSGTSSYLHHQNKRMECDYKGFYWQYGNDYNQQASACSVRCVKTPDTI